MATHRFNVGGAAVLGGAAILSAACLAAVAQAQAPTAGDAETAAAPPRALIDEIQGEVAEIRGLPFERSVSAELQSQAAFADYLARQLDQIVPPAIADHYDAVVRRLGLYRGSERLEIRSLMASVAASQTAAYYDPERETFFVLMQDTPAQLMGALYAHELYHGLQDQHFDLSAYLLEAQRDRSLNDDELLARRAVVEGEATYVMMLWTLQNLLGGLPPRALLGEAVRQQSRLDLDSLRAALQEPGAGALLGEETSAALDATESIPAFVAELLMGAYLKGLAFVFAVEERGWSEVEKLYAEYPPASTEQILHPEKWFAREAPATIERFSLESQAAFAGWEPLEQNVLGEIQWRIVFAEHDLGEEADSAAAGWDGDRYAVLRHEESGELLLLLTTAWDSEDDAAEFAAAYRRLLTEKYPDGAEPTRIARSGADVLVVEGGGDSIDAFLAFLRSARVTRAPRAAAQP